MWMIRSKIQMMLMIAMIMRLLSTTTSEYSNVCSKTTQSRFMKMTRNIK